MQRGEGLASPAVGEEPRGADFGSEPIADEPNCSISIDAEAYQKLRSGELNPQDAFMGGQINIEGDMQMAMQLALALMSPD